MCLVPVCVAHVLWPCDGRIGLWGATRPRAITCSRGVRERDSARAERELHRLVVLCLYVRSQRGISHTVNLSPRASRSTWRRRPTVRAATCLSCAPVKLYYRLTVLSDTTHSPCLSSVILVRQCPTVRQPGLSVYVRAMRMRERSPERRDERYRQIELDRAVHR